MNIISGRSGMFLLDLIPTDATYEILIRLNPYQIEDVLDLTHTLKNDSQFQERIYSSWIQINYPQVFRYYHSYRDQWNQEHPDESVDVLRMADELEIALDEAYDNRLSYQSGDRIVTLYGFEDIYLDKDPIVGLYNTLDNGLVEVLKLILANPSIKLDGMQTNNVYGYTMNELSPNKKEVLEVLLADDRFDPRWDDNWLIRKASKEGYLDVVVYLLTLPRVDPSARNDYALQYALDGRHYEVADLLLEDDRVDKYVLVDFIDDAMRVLPITVNREIINLAMKYPRSVWNKIESAYRMKLKRKYDL